MKTAHLALLIAFACVAPTSDAQTPKPQSGKTSQKTVQQKQAPAAPVVPEKAPEAAKPEPPKEIPATGPSGIGGLKLGMTREAAVLLGPSQPVRILDDLQEEEPKVPVPPEMKMYKTRIAVEGFSSPINVSLVFKKDVLTGISSTGSGKDLPQERLADVVVEVYGPGVVDDRRKEEQCIYRNGTSFTIKRGVMQRTWTTPSPEGKRIVTLFRDVVMNMCPSNLSTGSISIGRIQSFSMVLEEEPKPEPKQRLF